MSFYGLHRYERAAPMPRHRHEEPYMAIVVAGGYLEAGDTGRFEARPGDVILHGAFEAHLDAFHAKGATVLNLPLGPASQSGAGRIDDVDAIIRLAERDPTKASVRAQSELRFDKPMLSDWPDQLADALRDDPDLAIADWAHDMGLAAASVSRGFAKAYGVSPKRFRLEARALHAVRALAGWEGTLAALAAEHGFADQAHLARSAVALTGIPPSRLRTAVHQG